MPGTDLSYSTTKPRSGASSSASGASAGFGGLIALAFELQLIVEFCNRSVFGQFAKFTMMRHMVRDRDMLAEDMTWCPHELLTDTPEKMA